MPEKIRHLWGMGKRSWLASTPWGRAKIVGRVVQFGVWLAILAFVMFDLWQEFHGFHVAPLGWIVWLALFWLIIGGWMQGLETPTAVVARYLFGVDTPSPWRTILSDLATLGDRLVFSGGYVLAGLGIPIVFGVVELFILYHETDSSLSPAAQEELLVSTAVMVVIVAMVQMGLLLSRFQSVGLRARVKKDVETFDMWGTTEANAGQLYRVGIGLAAVITMVSTPVVLYA